MYSVKTVKKPKKKNVLISHNFIIFHGFLMGSHNKVFKIEECDIRKIKVISKELAHPLVIKKVSKQYEKLIQLLTELLLDDDDSGDSLREALNQIEKFRLQIKNKYREFLTQKELTKMSNQLKIIQKEASRRLLELNEYTKYQNQSHRSR
ncbi:MAG: hypothetical protein IKE70_03240 [Bacilli bacterium]|nr:hypothetical protein [Bacilli bacterium]